VTPRTGSTRGFLKTGGNDDLSFALKTQCSDGLGVIFNYPEDLRRPLPKSSVWLWNHVRQLANENPEYPLSLELWALSSPPAQQVTSYRSMWAYSSHYRCSGENDTKHVSYDSGIAGIFN
jgi:hypothetical protein